jgi:hypothetical protein
MPAAGLRLKAHVGEWGRCRFGLASIGICVLLFYKTMN